jgi:SsrA-binding protein
MSAQSDTPRIKMLVENRRARHDYDLKDKFEAGVALVGSEVKSLRAGKGNLQEAYVTVRANGVWLIDAHISPYAQANQFNHKPRRARRLLLHHHEISKLRKASKIRGMTIVPLKLYLKGSYVKLEIALGKGRQQHDKRHALKAREAKRDMDRRNG